MDYEKLYKEALERAKEYYDVDTDNTMTIYAKGTMEYLFPELRESEDERIRKMLIEFFGKGAENNSSTNGISDKDILAWLEKQGEQKPADKVEPKFRVGDWITNGDYTWEITEITVLDYVLRAQNGNIVDDTISYTDKQFNLWTIEDAKDGDVLYSPEYKLLWIYKNKEEYYAAINLNYANFTSFGADIEIPSDVCPATKEQCDTLFVKMKEAGYGWDAEKKELKKFHVIDECKDEMDYCFTKMMNGEKVSSAWSEVDAFRTSALIDVVKSGGSIRPELRNEFVDWLKSLRPQSKQEWSEEDEKTLNEIFSVAARACLRKSTLFGKSYDYIKWQNWLKSLKGRVQPKQEWSEEDDYMLESIISDFAAGHVSSIGQDKWLKSLKQRIGE